MAAKTILLVEDNLDIGELITHCLEKAQHSVAYFCRARLLGDDVIVMDVNGAESVLHPERFDLALIDGRLKGSPVNGPDLTPKLVKAGLAVIGISGDNWFNQEMIEAGARSAILKHDIFGMSVEGRLSFD